MENYATGSGRLTGKKISELRTFELLEKVKNDKESGVFN